MTLSHRQRDILTDLAALLAGLLLPLAFAPFQLPYLVFPLLAILLLTWSGATPGRAFRRGYLFGFGQFGFGVYWLHISINLFGGVNLVLALTATYLLVAFLALYPALTGWVLRRYFSRSHWFYYILAAAGIWTLAEWSRSWILTGFPWLNLGYSQIDTPLAGIAPLFGVYGISWFVILVAGLLACCVIHIRWQQRALALTAGLLVFVCGGLLQEISWTRADNRLLNVALIQGNVSQSIKWQPEQLQQTMRLYDDLTSAYWNEADLIVWPETAIPALANQIGDYLDLMQNRAQTSETLLVTGLAVHDRGNGRFYNSLLALGAHEDMYHKRHLVPFGEYMPFKTLLNPVLEFLQVPMSDFSSGDSNKPLLQLGSLAIGASICYEDAFGEDVIEALPEADILINVSNDAWFGDSIAPHQHLEIARMRALEAGRHMLRATNTGISAIIDPSGRIKARSPQFKPHALTAEIQTFTGRTPYTLFGNHAILVYIIVILCTIIVMDLYYHSDSRSRRTK